MGFYTTDSITDRPESVPLRTPPPSKNRVWDFSAISNDRAGFSVPQPVEPHQETWDTSTIIVSGVHYYGYRYYQPETGRWLGRDPIGEKGFERIRTEDAPSKVSKSGHTGQRRRNNSPPSIKMVQVIQRLEDQSARRRNKKIFNNPALKPVYLMVNNNPVG